MMSNVAGLKAAEQECRDHCCSSKCDVCWKADSIRKAIAAKRKQIERRGE